PNCGVPRYHLDQALTSPAPLDPQRLYLSVYPAPELAYRIEKKPEPFGSTVRPGSTPLWGGVHFINGYSPIGPSGVAREFEVAIHGEVRSDIGAIVLEKEGGADGKLARIGVDGIIVAHEIHLDPQPPDEWELADYTEEGRVFHRTGSPFARLRSVTEIDSRPNEQFAEASVSRIINGRNRLLADVTVPPNGPPALLTISRPFFSGYRATIGNLVLRVDSHRGVRPGVADSRASRPLIHVTFVTLFVLQLLDVVVGRRHVLAALFLDDLAQRGIDILGHTACVAADKKLRAFAVDPFPNLARI